MSTTILSRPSISLAVMFLVTFAGLAFMQACGARADTSELKTLTPTSMKIIIERATARMIAWNPSSAYQNSTVDEIVPTNLMQSMDLPGLVNCGKREGWWSDSTQPGPPLQPAAKYPQLFEEGSPVFRIESQRTLGLMARAATSYEVRGPITQLDPNEKEFPDPKNPVANLRSPRYICQARYFVRAAQKTALATCGVVPVERTSDIGRLVVRFARSAETGIWFIVELDQFDVN